MDNSWREATHRTVLSLEPDTMVFPSGLTATLYTPLACPSNILLTWPDARSHTLVREGRFRSKISLNSNPESSAARSDSPQRLVFRPRYDGLAIRADGDASHPAGVPLECGFALARGQLPYAGPCGKVSEAKLVIDLKRIESARSHSPDGLVAGARHYGLAIRTHGYADDLSGVPFECALAFARGKVPHAMSCGKVSEQI